MVVFGVQCARFFILFYLIFLEKSYFPIQSIVFLIFWHKQQLLSPICL